MKTLKILPNVLALLRDVLLENDLAPEKLQATLGIFATTLEVCRNSNLLKNDIERQLINEVAEGTDSFLVILELCTLFGKKGKI